MNNCPANCDTVQLIEPKNDLLVDTSGNTSDVDERGEVTLTAGQNSVVVTFLVPKLSANYTFEYLYVDAVGIDHPGSVVPVPTVRQVDGFAVALAGAPIGTGYVLHWRVVVASTTTLAQIDAPEDLYLQIPRDISMAVTFVNPRSNTNYGFSELRVENLHDPNLTMAVINVQVYNKTLTGFLLAINPVPRTDNYFLRVRTP